MLLGQAIIALVLGGVLSGETAVSNKMLVAGEPGRLCPSVCNHAELSRMSLHTCQHTGCTLPNAMVPTARHQATIQLQHCAAAISPFNCLEAGSAPQGHSAETWVQLQISALLGSSV